MSLASGIGSMPGDDARAYTETTRWVLGELGLPFVPELPGRGAGAGMTGRGVAVLADLGADLQPAGWRLTDAVGVDQRRARSLLAQDLDTVEEAAAGYEGPFKVQVAGPWTLAATVERPRGDKVLADHGARRDLAQSLAAGVADHVADVRRRVPGASEVWVQVDEPALPAVLAARVPTASGFGKHRSVEPAVASEALGWVLAAIAEAGGVPVVHCCADDAPIGLIRGAGESVGVAVGIAVDVARIGAEGLDDLAQAIEDDARVLLGVVPTTGPADERAGVASVERLLEMLGLEPHAGLVITPACGLAGTTPGDARRRLEVAAAVARGF